MFEAIKTISAAIALSIALAIVVDITIVFTGGFVV